MRLAILSTHPIQYLAPVFRELNGGPLDIHVFYGWEGMSAAEGLDRGFGRAIKWDVPLLEGYSHTFLKNRSRNPGSHHYRGIDSHDVVGSISSWRPDALLVIGWKYASHLRAMRYFHGRIPVLFRGDSTLIDEMSTVRSLIRRWILRVVYRHVDLALYVGQHNKRYFEHHGFSPDQLEWAPHSIDNKRFSGDATALNADARHWRRQLGIPDDSRVILYSGKLEEKKDPLLLLDAFLKLKDVPAHLVFGGTGPLEDRLRRRAAGRSDIHFVGFQNQSRMPILYRVGDVFVLPSKGPGETWGLAVNEAMACSRPVIVSDRVGCAPDLVHHEQNGYVFASGDATALRRAIQRVLGDETRRQGMGRRSAEIIRAWSIEVQAQRVAEATTRIARR